MSAAFPWPYTDYDSLQALDIDAERQATNSPPSNGDNDESAYRTRQRFFSKTCAEPIVTGNVSEKSVRSR
jgi:hypothetical protein